MSRHIGRVCERCGGVFLTPYHDTYQCRACYLGALSPVDRAVALVNPWSRS